MAPKPVILTSRSCAVAAPGAASAATPSAAAMANGLATDMGFLLLVAFPLVRQRRLLFGYLIHASPSCRLGQPRRGQTQPTYRWVCWVFPRPAPGSAQPTQPPASHRLRPGAAGA